MALDITGDLEILGGDALRRYKAREEAYEAMRAALTPGSSDHDWDGLVSWAKAAGYPATQDEAGWRHIALKLAEKVLVLNETRLRALALAEQADA